MTFRYFFSDTCPGYFLQILPVTLLTALIYRFIGYRKDNVTSKRMRIFSCLSVCRMTGLICPAVFTDIIHGLRYEASYHTGYGLHTGRSDMNFNLIPGFFNHISSEVTGSIILSVPYGVLYPLYKKNITLKKTSSDGLKLTLITELIQPVFGRSSDVNDTVMDSAGVSVSSTVYFPAVRRINEQLHSGQPPQVLSENEPDVRMQIQETAAV